jgi:hypothetical protein
MFAKLGIDMAEFNKALADGKKNFSGFASYISKGLSVKVHGDSLLSDMRGAGTMLTGLFGKLASAGSLFFAPLTGAIGLLKSAVPYASALAASAIGIGTAATVAAGGYEQMYLRVKGMVGSATETKDILERASKLRAKTIFSDEDAASALVALRNVGMMKDEAIEAVADAASATEQTMSDAAYGVLTMRARSLRQFGVFMSKEKDNYILEFTDKAGNDIRKTAKDIDAARTEFVSILREKFTGSAIMATKTFGGVFARIKHAIGEAFQDFGKGLLPTVKYLGASLTDKLNEWVASGQMEEWGKRVGSWIEKAVSEVGGWILTIPSIWKELTVILQESPDKLRRGIMDALRVGGELLAELVLISIKSTAGFWVAVGKGIAAVFGTMFTRHMSEFGFTPKVRFAAEEGRNNQIKDGAALLMDEYESLKKQIPPDSIAEVMANASNGRTPRDKAWEALVERNPYLKGGNISQIDAMKKYGDQGDAYGRNSDYVAGIQDKSATRAFADFAASAKGLAVQTAQETADAVLRAKGKLATIGTDTISAQSIEAFKAEQAGHAKDIQAGIDKWKAELETPDKKGKKKKGDEEAEATASTVKSTSFIDYVKQAQEAVFQNKMLDYAKKTAEATVKLASDNGTGEPQLVP